MQLRSNNLNLLTLLSLGFASQVLFVECQAPPAKFPCSDAQQTIGFCVGPKDSSNSESILVLANFYKTEENQPATFDCEGLEIKGQEAEKAACCSQNFGLKKPGEKHDISTADFGTTCKYVTS